MTTTSVRAVLRAGASRVARRNRFWTGSAVPLDLPFPGAVPRTVEDKLAERLSARDFGATAEDMTAAGTGAYRLSVTASIANTADAPWTAAASCTGPFAAVAAAEWGGDLVRIAKGSRRLTLDFGA